MGVSARVPAFDRPALTTKLQADLVALRLPLAAPQIEALIDYLALMQRWNATYNLTAIRDPEQMLTQHIVDSLSVVPELARHLAGAAARVVDVGSGGGLPGVVLAIVQPAWTVQCVDAVEKKTAFVRQVAGTLRLANLSATHARVEALAPAEADIVTSRAFASLEDFSALAGRHVRRGGRMAAMKGHQPEDEITALLERGTWAVEGVTPLAVPRLDAQRCVVWLKRPADEEGSE